MILKKIFEKFGAGVDNQAKSSAKNDLIRRDFSTFTYSRGKHFNFFSENNYDVMLYGERFPPAQYPLKRFQDLLVFSFIEEMIPKASRILEVGGGSSRIIEYYKKSYEVWNIDKMEGLGNGPKTIQPEGFRHVNDYMGNFNQELPDGYFDLVFSISALEHVAEELEVFENITNDIQRVLKPGGYSLHCLDSVLSGQSYWTNGLLGYFFDNIDTINKFIPFDEIREDPDLFVLSEENYDKYWKPLTGKSYQAYGMPFSYNVLWQK